MKKVKLTRLTLLNFKGVRNLTVDFGENLTSISGRNGSGKTSIFDAFTWLLFGKNSDDAKDFNIKTLDENGNAIPKLPHEVTAELEVGGQKFTLCRKFVEKWTKKRGSANEEFAGHTTELYYNEVPCDSKEWAEKINAICPENVFKLVTNPLAFTSMKPMAQREVLIRMAGNITNEEIAGENAEFVDLINVLTDKTLEEYKKEVASKKKRIKAEIDALPERISERMRDLDQGTDFAQFETDIKTLKAELQSVESALISDKDKVDLAQGRINALNKALNDAKSLRMKKENELRQFFGEEFFAAQKKANDYRFSISKAEADIRILDNTIAMAVNLIENKTQEAENLRTEWRKENEKVLYENDLICPVCGRFYDEDKIATIKANFNQEKAKNLQEISVKGHKVKDELAKAQSNMAGMENEKERLMKDIEVYKARLAQLPTEMPDFSERIATDPSIEALNKDIAELESELAKEVLPTMDEELVAEKKDLEANIEYCTKVLALKEVDEANRKRIAELEESLSAGNEELTRLEGIEFSIQQFGKRRINLIEDRINGMFKVVSFKMFNTQINGGEEETCEAMVNGVPFKDLNHASKINAGLDIINALSKFEDVSAPVFIDNAEAINEVMQTDSQMICLRVSEDDLKIE